MKQPKKLTRSQKEFVSKHKMKPENWMLQYEDEKTIVFVHKSGKKTRKFEKPL